MSGVEEISPEAWADACDSRGDLFTATVIRRLVAERDEARAERDQWESLLYSHSHTIERFRAERDEALGEATRLAELYTLAVHVLDTVLSALTDAPRTPESGPLAAERPEVEVSGTPEADNGSAGEAAAT